MTKERRQASDRKFRKMLDQFTADLVAKAEKLGPPSPLPVGILFPTLGRMVAMGYVMRGLEMSSSRWTPQQQLEYTERLYKLEDVRFDAAAFFMLHHTASTIRSNRKLASKKQARRRSKR